MDSWRRKREREIGEWLKPCLSYASIMFGNFVERCHWIDLEDLWSTKTIRSSDRRTFARLTSNGFRLKYVAPGRRSRSICCSDVRTESRFSIAFTWENESKVMSWRIAQIDTLLRSRTAQTIHPLAWQWHWILAWRSSVVTSRAWWFAQGAKPSIRFDSMWQNFSKGTTRKRLISKLLHMKLWHQQRFVYECSKRPMTISHCCG